MNLEPGISLAAILLAALSLAFSLLCLRKQYKGRELLNFAEKQIEDLQTIVGKKNETIESLSQRLAEQSRRIAWLENRVRQPKTDSDETVTEVAIHETPKLNITERRHLVMSLLAKGQNVEQIAMTLGMLQGEVELIMNLSQAVKASK